MNPSLGVDQATLDLFSSEGAPDLASREDGKRAAAQRGLKIRRILDARFSLSVIEESKNDDPAWWNSTRNDMGRGHYGEAMRELRRLEAATDDELGAELAAIALRDPPLTHFVASKPRNS